MAGWSGDGFTHREAPYHTPGIGGASRRTRSGVLGRVLHVLTGLLEVPLDLVALALTTHRVVASGAADLLLGVSGDLLDLVLGLVVGSHGGLRPARCLLTV